MDLRQTEAYASYMRRIGWKTQEKDGVFFYFRNLPLTPFYVMKVQRPKSFLKIETINSLIKKNRVIKSYLEPSSTSQVSIIKSWDYKYDKTPFLPSNTLMIDLTKSHNSLLSKMKPKTRYNIGLAKRRGVVVDVVGGVELIQNPTLFEDLFMMQKQNAKRLGVFTLPKKWFRNQVEAFENNCYAAMAYHEQELVAATFYMTSKDGSFYSHNGSSLDGRRVFAPTLCVWEGVLEAKKRGLKWLDLEGIYDPRSKISKWKGFSRFKGGFTSLNRVYPGLYSKWHFPL